MPINGTNDLIKSETEHDAAHIRFRDKGPLESYRCFSCGNSFESTSMLSVIEHFGRISHERFHSICFYCNGKVHKYLDKQKNVQFYHDCGRWKRQEDK